MTGLVGKRGQLRALCIIANQTRVIPPVDIAAPYGQHGA
ncbi:hypothetical protein MSTE_00666 [Mycobacteroides stephanolepidis]|uniref:Uncharacterized protein n=1 Tax=[Mycobacterium] stephanolepidis TaxID=1520670 RepID=A0A1Z4ESR1_9MYCO|nr:hypothetical protein MSTE_00666 [[Mycobacterium] stephanolepidis]